MEFCVPFFIVRSDDGGDCTHGYFRLTPCGINSNSHSISIASAIYIIVFFLDTGVTRSAAHSLCDTAVLVLLLR